MSNYILAYYDGGKAPANPEVGAEGMAKFQKWLADLGDAVVNPGTPLGKAKTVSSSGVSDSESSYLTGFSIVKADSLDAALKMTKDCPFLEMGTIDVAEAMEM